MSAYRRPLAAGVFALTAALVLTYLLYLAVPVGYDFYHWYRPIPLAWLAGDTRLYDEASRGFFPPPWAKSGRPPADP